MVVVVVVVVVVAVVVVAVAFAAVVAVVVVSSCFPSLFIYFVLNLPFDWSSLLSSALSLSSNYLVFIVKVAV